MASYTLPVVAAVIGVAAQWLLGPWSNEAMLGYIAGTAMALGLHWVAENYS